MRRLAWPLSVLVAIASVVWLASQFQTYESEQVCFRCGARLETRQVTFASEVLDRTRDLRETPYSRAVAPFIPHHEHDWHTLWSRQRSLRGGEHEEDSVAHVLLPRVLEHPGGIARVWEFDEETAHRFLYLYTMTPPPRENSG